jgi:hypothetical protein
MITPYHGTTRYAAGQILRDGFRDSSGNFGADAEWERGWFSDLRIDCDEGAQGDWLLRVELALTEADITIMSGLSNTKCFVNGLCRQT